MTMSRNEIIILVGVLCASASIWMLESFPWALLMLGIYIILFGLAKAIVDD